MVGGKNVLTKTSQCKGPEDEYEPVSLEVILPVFTDAKHSGQSAENKMETRLQLARSHILIALTSMPLSFVGMSDKERTFE